MGREQCQQGLGQKKVEMEEINLELGSSLSQEQDPLPSVGPLPPHLLPLPDHAAEE